MITIGNETFDISSGAFIDFGVTSEAYEASFALSDATLTPRESSFSFSTSASIVIVFNLFSPGNTLASGTYTKGDEISPSGSVFLDGVVQVNGNASSITGGTIQFSGSAPNFTVQLDVSLSSGEQLSGGYSGTYIE